MSIIVRPIDLSKCSIKATLKESKILWSLVGRKLQIKDIKLEHNLTMIEAFSIMRKFEKKGILKRIRMLI